MLSRLYEVPKVIPATPYAKGMCPRGDPISQSCTPNTLFRPKHLCWACNSPLPYLNFLNHLVHLISVFSLIPKGLLLQLPTCSPQNSLSREESNMTKAEWKARTVNSGIKLLNQCWVLLKFGQLKVQFK